MNNLAVKDRGVFECSFKFHGEENEKKFIVPVNQILFAQENPFDVGKGYKQLVKDIMDHYACLGNCHVDAYSDAIVTVTYNNKRIAARCSEVEYEPHYHFDSFEVYK